MSLEDMPKRSYRELHNLVAARRVVVDGWNTQREDRACCSWAQRCICYTPILPMWWVVKTHRVRFDRSVPVVYEATGLSVQTPYMQISTNKTRGTSSVRSSRRVCLREERKKEREKKRNKTLICLDGKRALWLTDVELLNLPFSYVLHVTLWRYDESSLWEEEWRHVGWSSSLMDLEIDRAWQQRISKQHAGLFKGMECIAWLFSM